MIHIRFRFPAPGTSTPFLLCTISFQLSVDELKVVDQDISLVTMIQIGVPHKVAASTIHHLFPPSNRRFIGHEFDRKRRHVELGKRHTLSVSHRRFPAVG